MNRIRKGDEVVVIAGKDRGKRGIVLNVGVNGIRSSLKISIWLNAIPRVTPCRERPGHYREGDGVCNFQYCAVNPVANRPDRVGFRFLEDGRKVRYFKSNNEVVDV